MDHLTKLNLICRICGEDIMKNSVDLNRYSERIENSFYVNTSNDNKKVRPQKMSRRCYTILKNIEKGASRYATCYNFMNSSETINKNPLSELGEITFFLNLLSCIVVLSLKFTLI